MPIEIANNIIPLIGFALGGTFFLVALRMVLTSWKGRTSSADFARLTEAVERLEDQVSDLRHCSEELAERVDFAERMIGRGSEAAVPEALPRS
jgi:hypothetical protein